MRCDRFQKVFILTTAEKEIIVMENALYDQKATSKLLRHFHIVVLKSST